MQAQSPSRFHWSSFGQLLLSGIGFLLFAAGGLIFLLLGLSGLLSGRSQGAEALPYFSLVWISGLVCLLLLPSILLAVFRLLEKPLPAWHWRGEFRAASWAMLAWPLAIAAGALISNTGTLSWLFLPPLQLFAVGLPLWWLIEFGRRGLAGNSPQRNWGILSVGLLISPTVAVIAEFVLIGVVVVLFAVWFSSQPGALQQLTLLAQRITNAGGDPEAMLRIFRPIAMNPVVLILVLLVACGFIPMIEELVKPLGLWILVGKEITPAQGFLAGMLCGAAFALLESLGSLANPSGQQDWLIVVLGRTGTGVLHTVTTSLMGWGLASTWKEGRYLRLAGIYLLAVGLHGLWNVFGILVALPDLFGPAAVTGIVAVFLRLGQVAPFAMAVLTIVLLLILLYGHRRLRLQSGTIGTASSN